MGCQTDNPTQPSNLRYRRPATCSGKDTTGDSGRQRETRAKMGKARGGVGAGVGVGGRVGRFCQKGEEHPCAGEHVHDDAEQNPRPPHPPRPKCPTKTDETKESTRQPAASQPARPAPAARHPRPGPGVLDSASPAPVRPLSYHGDVNKSPFVPVSRLHDSLNSKSPLPPSRPCSPCRSPRVAWLAWHKAGRRCCL